MKSLAFALAALVVAGCSLSTAGDPGSSESAGATGHHASSSSATAASSTSSSGGGGGAGGGTMAGSGGAAAGTGGGPLVGDSMPPTAISFFGGTTTACPKGWTVVATSVGRTIIPVSGADPAGVSVGDPLASGEDRKHGHHMSGSFSLDDVGYAGVAGCCDHSVAQQASVSFDADLEEASLGIPYVQLLTCQKTDVAVPGAAPIPPHMVSFFDAATCPTGWTRTSLQAGRLLVGLPFGAMADAPFGGTPISQMLDPIHGHQVDTTLATTSEGVGLASGGTDGYAKNGSYDVSVQSTNTAGGFPYLTLLQCEKQ